MDFWYIGGPDTSSDYRHSYVNGSLHHPYGLPGIVCDVCGQSWAGFRTLGDCCPVDLRNEQAIIQRSPIGRTEHVALQERILRELGKKGHPFVDLRPGDRLQPSYLNVPSRPCADFLWPDAGNGLVVSERVKDLLRELCRDEVAIYPVILGRIGAGDARARTPRPRTGEPEDLINEVTLLNDHSDVGPYHEVIVLNESRYPPDTTIQTCEGCGRSEINCPNRALAIMTAQMWRGQSIFVLAPTRLILITDDLRKRIRRLRPTNVEFNKKHVIQTRLG